MTRGAPPALTAATPSPRAAARRASFSAASIRVTRAHVAGPRPQPLELDRPGGPQPTQHRHHRVAQRLIARPDTRHPLIRLDRDTAERRRALRPRRSVLQRRERRRDIGTLVAGRPRHQRLDPRIIQWTRQHHNQQVAPRPADLTPPLRRASPLQRQRTYRGEDPEGSPVFLHRLPGRRRMEALTNRLANRSVRRLAGDAGALPGGRFWLAAGAAAPTAGCNTRGICSACRWVRRLADDAGA